MSGTDIIRVSATVRETGHICTDGLPVTTLKLRHFELPDGRRFRLKKNKDTGRTERVWLKRGPGWEGTP